MTPEQLEAAQALRERALEDVIDTLRRCETMARHADPKLANFMLAIAAAFETLQRGR
jgi:hypothetical protein